MGDLSTTAGSQLAGDLSALVAAWKDRDPRANSPDLHRALATRYLELGEPLMAYDAASDGLRSYPDDVRLRQLRGLSLSRSGAIDAAGAAFRQLADEGHGDEETLGNLARTYKALWLRSSKSEKAEKGSIESLRREAQEAYLYAYQQTGGYWSGVNAAALALAGGDRDEARRLAGAVLRQCASLLGQPAAADDYWLRATCGEASLIAGNIEEARRWYAEAAHSAGRRYANVATTRSQARLVCEFAGVPWGELESCFALPRVVVCTGHMIDAPGRPQARFPPALVGRVSQEIEARLARWAPVIGYSSAACGADLLFLESLAKLRQDAVVVLPFAPARFARDSVDFAGDEWHARFEAVLRAVGEPVIASTWDMPAGGAAYDYANRILCGLAKIQADLFDVPLELLAVWDRQTHGEAGGAATLVARWRKQKLPVEQIDLRALAPLAAPTSVEARSSPATLVQTSKRRAAPRQELVAMLFADALGFSKLSDEQILPFVTKFLGRIGKLIRKGKRAPLAVNTWGDGVFATFRGVREAGQCALELAEMAATTDWEQWGLPAGFSIRIALHAGPVFALRDPVTSRRGFWGGHISRAARIEPVTPPGQVYASQAFAALARDEGDCGFTCQYVGRTPLAKDYGTFPTYHVEQT